MTPNKAAGPDGTNPKFLINLNQTAKHYFLHLFNQFWNNHNILQAWCTADITPIPKRERMPVRLKSCTGKLMERIITNRLNYHLEKHKIIVKEQAGFRKRRSTEEQLIRLSQSFSNGFHSKAYDKVWRTGFVYKMLQIDACFAQQQNQLRDSKRH